LAEVVAVFSEKRSECLSYKLSQGRLAFRAIGSPTLIARDPFTGDFSGEGTLVT